jgi:hypothetical protein
VKQLVAVDCHGSASHETRELACDPYAETLRRCRKRIRDWGDRVIGGRTLREPSARVSRKVRWILPRYLSGWRMLLRGHSLGRMGALFLKLPSQCTRHEAFATQDYLIPLYRRPEPPSFPLLFRPCSLYFFTLHLIVV